MKFYASAPRGMTELLVEELKLHGAQKIQTGGGSGATFEGTLETAYRLCLWGRILNRVLLPITTVRAATPEILYDEVKTIRWERHMKSSGTLAVDCSAVDSAIGHSKYAALKVKDAIVDRFRDQFGERPSVDTEMPDIRVALQLRGDSGRLSLDLSGQSLHRRGYRIEGAHAPLKENLAAAILEFAGWKEIAQRGGPLIDPMCGSGTFLIEGALIAADIAPGLYRDYFGFLYWKGHDEELWQRLLAEARERREEGLKKLPPIIGFDQDYSALSAAKGNIARVGLVEQITVEERALDSLQALPDLPRGLLVVNPPYGERLGEVNELKSLYAQIGERLQTALPGWQAALFTGNPELAAYVGLRSDKLLTLFNGPLECQLFRYNVPEETAQGETINPALADSEGAQMFANRLRKNLKNLGKWAQREGIDCYRLYDADLPEYAVAVDLYRGEKLWVHVQEYEAPK
ncbi:MAG TPA: bifunctional 23S rRNA (guanine(2069)-N(7))-methyltransferase RlmK/23S rRNA (guanine(2445)-N(2))-methyltransferase RlmL, partial [Gammaproteobacteria bacterium]